MASGKLSCHYGTESKSPSQHVTYALLLCYKTKDVSKHIAIHVFCLFMPIYGNRFCAGKVEYSLS